MRSGPPASGPGPSARRVLGRTLDRLYARFNAEQSADDPVWRARQFTRADDREIVAFFAAALAFGRVRSVLNTLDGLLDAMGPSPVGFVRAFDPSRDRRRFDRLGHRWTRGRDLAALAWLLRQMLDRAGSIEGFFAEALRPGAVDVEAAVESFSTRAMLLDVGAVYGPTRPVPGVAYFFPRPSSGGACKRLNLFLRWMVRRDRVDLGVWGSVRPAQLIVPLDTHVIRVGRCLGLTRRATPGWRMALDITRTLATLDPDDPVKYDFALCHVGMAGLCGLGTPRGDARCPFKGACHPRATPTARR